MSNLSMTAEEKALRDDFASARGTFAVYQIATIRHLIDIIDALRAECDEVTEERDFWNRKWLGSNHEATMPRFFVEHGTWHDRKTGRHLSDIVAGCPTSERLGVLLTAVSDHDQTPEEARAELEADGVDVDTFLARLGAL